MQQKEFLVIANIHRRKVLRVLDKTMHGLLSVKIFSKDLYVLNYYNYLYTLYCRTIKIVIVSSKCCFKCFQFAIFYCILNKEKNCMRNYFTVTPSWNLHGFQIEFALA